MAYKLVVTDEGEERIDEQLQYIRISDEILEPEEIVDMWVNGK